MQALPLLLSALLPLDVTPPGAPGAPSGLRLSIDVTTPGVIEARISNGGAAPVKLWLGDECGEEGPLTLAVDGKGARFEDRKGKRSECPRVARTVAPGTDAVIVEGYAPPGDGPHTVAVGYGARAGVCAGCFAGVIPAAKREVPARRRMVLKLGVVGRAAERPPIAVVSRFEVEIIHQNPMGEAPLDVLTGRSCSGSDFDTLLVDEREYRRGVVECDKNADVRSRLAPGSSFLTRRTLELRPGLHTLSARYQVPASEAPPGGLWGEFRTTTLLVKVLPR